jgi:chemotaxis protein methyltransferase WspC
MTAELRGIEWLLASRIGLDPVSVGRPLILRAATQRMTELGLDDLGAYERHVRSSEPELQALIEEVVVAESWFFRDERPFEWLREYVRTRWLDDSLRPPLRVLSLACAGGEEPYSIAMVLHDLGLPARRFEIDAVDISDRRLAIARRGVYSLNAFRGVDAGYKVRYFREHPQGYELNSTVRSAVRFLQASVVEPGLLDGSLPYDVLFCRNLLIYLGDSARACVLAAIDRLLAPNGLLVIGHADRLDSAAARGKFTAVGDPGCFAYRRTAPGGASVSSFPVEPSRRSSTQPPSPGMPPKATEAPIPLHKGRITPRSGVSNHEDGLVARAAEPPALLDHALALANQGRFDEAIAVCQRYLQQQGLSAQAYCLMGMICQAAGDRVRAEVCFQKTVYLDPSHDEALLALALLAERRGDSSAAAGFRRRAERTIAMTRKRAN